MWSNGGQQDAFLLDSNSTASCRSDDSFLSACSDLGTVHAPLLSVSVTSNEPVAEALRSVQNASDTTAGKAPSLRPADSYAHSDSAVARACFDGDLPRLHCLLKGQGAACLDTQDAHGNAPLHIAAMRGHPACVDALVAAGATLNAKSSNGWLAIDEALCYQRPTACASLLKHHQVGMKRKQGEKAAQLHAVMADMPDCAFQMKWELSSPVLGLLLGKYLPHDTYTVWKCGTRMRIDGSLKGLDEDGVTMLPTWKYGAFSILVDAAPAMPTAMLVNHDNKSHTPLELEAGDDGDGNSEVDMTADALMMDGQGVRRSRVKFCNFKLQPVKGWITSELKEDIDGITTTVYEAQGELVANTVIKQQLAIVLKSGSTYDDYLRAAPIGNIVAEVPLNFSNGFSANAAEGDANAAAASARPSGSAAEAGASGRSAASSGRSHGVDGQQGGSSRGPGVPDVGPGFGEVSIAAPGVKLSKGKGRGRKVKARLWMGHNFPLNQKQLLPLLDIMGTTNKHIKKVATFMRKFGDLEMFPVKLQLPIMLSMRIAVRVKHLCVWGKPMPKKASKGAPASVLMRPDPSFFEVPRGYKLKAVADIIESSVKKAEARHAEAQRAELESSAGHTPSASSGASPGSGQLSANWGGA